jgi:hypothetical protein
MESLNRRAATIGGVGFEHSGSVLAVGARTAVLDDVSDRSEVLRTYFDLVAGQRSAPLATRIDLRDRDILSLASILDLAPVQLERYIDRELTRFVEATAADGGRRAAPAGAGLMTIRKLYVGLLMLSAAVLAAVGATVVAHVTASAQPTPTAPAAALTSGATVRVEADPDGTGTIVITESAPAPAAADGSEIGSAVQIERQSPRAGSPR